uniref:Membrane-associated kinase regulator 4 n=1 Tax=Leersia perrieri TaxID=77586 RepID=A0A0D9WC58_9ORYZ
MARSPTMVIQEDYIDMDLTPTTTTPSSPRRAGRDFEFRSSSAAVFASPADELFYKGNLLPLHLPPRLQLVQKLLHDQQLQLQGIKKASSIAAAASVPEVEDDIDMSKVCAKKYSWSKRLKLMKRWTSREYIKSLFLATTTTKSGDIAAAAAGAGGGNVGAVLDQEELCGGGHRKSFSGIIRRVRLVVATKSASSTTSPLCSTSSSSSSTPSCGRAASSVFLKRSSSAGSEEGAIQGAIAHCKRSQHLHLHQQQRRSVSDVVFYSVNNTPRVSSVAAGEVAGAQPQERQEMCRG